MLIIIRTPFYGSAKACFTIDGSRYAYWRNLSPKDPSIYKVISMTEAHEWIKPYSDGYRDLKANEIRAAICCLFYGEDT